MTYWRVQAPIDKSKIKQFVDSMKECLLDEYRILDYDYDINVGWLNFILVKKEDQLNH